MNPVWRAATILAEPAAEWARIEKELGDPAYVLSRYVALLALIPPASEFVGACIVGVIVPGTGIVYAPLVDGLFGALVGYVAAFAAVLLLGLLINVLAPLFGGRRDFESALKLAAYSYTPVWLAGVFLVLPGLRFLTLLGFYGVYLLLTGLPRLMKTPPSRTFGLSVAVVGFACLLSYLAVTAQRVLFATPT